MQNPPNIETYLNMENLASRQNFQIEKHEVTTNDGYILTLYRIFRLEE